MQTSDFNVLCSHTSYFILQVVLVTDGSLGIGKGSLRHSLQTLKHCGDDKKFPLPFPFPTKLYIMCVANAEEVMLFFLKDFNINTVWYRTVIGHNIIGNLFVCRLYSCIYLRVTWQNCIVQDKVLKHPLEVLAHTPVAVLLQLQMSDTMNNLEELLRLSGGDGQIFTVDGALCMKSVQAMFGYDSEGGK